MLGLDGEILVDIGQCRQSCSTKRTKINRKEFEAILKANYSVDPVEVFIVFFCFYRLFSLVKKIFNYTGSFDGFLLPTVIFGHAT